MINLESAILKRLPYYLKKFFIAIMSLLNKAKNFINKATNKTVVYFKAFLYIDFLKRNLIEILFALAILTIMLVSQYYTSLESKKWVIVLLLVWAFLALLGFFIPTIKQRFVFGYPGQKTTFIPILLEIKSKGGFIAGRKIRLLAKVINIQKDIDSKQEFRNKYDEFSIVYFQSIRLPIKPSRFLEGNPETGGVTINIKNCKGKATILFSSPGGYKPRTLYKIKGNPKLLSDEVTSPLDPRLTVTPSETYVSLRNYAITYSLTLVILLLTILQLKLI
jgi:hypothetical protein